MAEKLRVTDDMFVNNRWLYLDTELDLSEMFNDERGEKDAFDEFKERAEREEMDRRFTYHPPTGEQKELYSAIRHIARDMAMCIRDLCPDCHEKQVAIDALDVATMMANAAIARHPE